MIATKEMELKALAKIEKILADLGENSYLAYAFDGCVEDARRNIEEDAAYSMKDRYESATRDADYFHALANTLGSENEKLERTSLDLDTRRALTSLCYEENNRVGSKLASLKNDIVNFSVVDGHEDERRNAVDAYKALTKKNELLGRVTAALEKTFKN